MRSSGCRSARGTAAPRSRRKAVTRTTS
uniref:Uncharacterized protein n=1 Tax=Arundo donax TaxID=35708 RepID=A0A0A9F0E8_ARUDO